MENITDSFEKLLALLPTGWEAKAKDLGAYTRRGQEGKVQTVKDLIFVIVAYIIAGSFGKTSALLQMGGKIRLNKNAVLERMQKCAVYLEWLCTNIYRNSGLLAEKPEWLEGKKVCLLDGSDENLYGSKGSDYRLHYCIDLFTLAVEELHLTTIKTGEKLRNFSCFGENAVVIGDRAYGTIQGIEYMNECSCDFVIRLKTDAFNLYDEDKNKIELADYLVDLEVFGSKSLNFYYKVGTGYKPIRICALRKDEEGERKGMKHLKKSSDTGKVSERCELYNRYIIVATSFNAEISCEKILELYRTRWQIEIAFKRIKTLFHYDEVPIKKDEELAKAWFYSRLLFEAMCTSLVNQGRFSPSTE